MLHRRSEPGTPVPVRFAAFEDNGVLEHSRSRDREWPDVKQRLEERMAR